MADSTVSTCKNSGSRIVLTNYAMGPEWDHQPQGAAFQDSVSRYCSITRAEPSEVTA